MAKKARKKTKVKSKPKQKTKKKRKRRKSSLQVEVLRHGITKILGRQVAKYSVCPDCGTHTDRFGTESTWRDEIGSCDIVKFYCEECRCEWQVFKKAK